MNSIFSTNTDIVKSNSSVYLKMLFVCMAFYLALSLSASTADNISEEVKNKTSTQKAILVLDASGSMWGKVDDKYKIQIARDVVKNTVSHWDENIELGLMAYGHRKKGDCNDIELLLQPRPLDAKSFISAANKLNPTGKTPLSAAVKQAAEALDYKNTQATVILVSDGKETCNLDPCEVGKNLEGLGLDFTAHIIGFDVPKKETQGMRCLAENTGGVFLEANNSSELEEALKDTADIVSTDVTSEKTELDLSPATLSVINPVLAGAPFPVEWVGPMNEYDQIHLISMDNSENYDTEFVDSEEGANPAIFSAPDDAGEYKLEYRTKKGDVLATTTVQVIPALATLNILKNEIIAGNEIDIEWTGPANKKDQIMIYNIDGTPFSIGRYTPNQTVKQLKESTVSPVQIDVPETPGDYLVVYRTAEDEKVLASKPITVTAAKGWVRVSGPVQAGKSFELEWSGPENNNDRLRIFSTDTDKKYHSGFANRNTANKARQGRATKLIAPKESGTYVIKLLTGEKRELASVPLIVK